jgi:hypothetical protein
MNSRRSASRLTEKSTLHAIQVELQQGYSLSPVEAQVLATRVQELVDEQSGLARQPGQITYQAISVDEPAGKPLKQCRKIPVHLTLVGEGDAQLWAEEGAIAVRRVRVHRLTYEAFMQGGALSQEDLACILGISLKTVKRVFAFYREQDRRLPSRGEIRDMGRGVSHKIPIIRKYVQDLSLSSISVHLGRHGITSMVRYLRHFSLIMILEDRGLSPGQMQSVVGISENLVKEYLVLYSDLNRPEYERTLDRIKRTCLRPATEVRATSELPMADCDPHVAEKGGTV